MNDLPVSGFANLPDGEGGTCGGSGTIKQSAFK